MDQSQGLIVRQHNRHAVSLPVELSVSPEHAQRVIFSATSGARAGVIEATLVDVSGGGLGVLSSMFVPRNTHALMRVLNPCDLRSAPLLETTVRIARVTMTDRRPAYLLGGVFLENDDSFHQRFDRFMRGLEVDEAPVHTRHA